MKLASRGQRDLDTGPEDITDAGQLASVRRQARVVHTRSLLGAVIVMGLLLLI